MTEEKSIERKALVFAEAKPEDASEIMELYRSLIGSPGCSWSLEYPSLEIVSEDIESRSAYVLREPGRIVAAASAEDFAEVAHLPWTPKNPRMLSRVGVCFSLHRQGVASLLVQSIIRAVKAKGYDGVVLLANRENRAAHALYGKCGFLCVGEVALFSQDFYRYEMTF